MTKNLHRELIFRPRGGLDWRIKLPGYQQLLVLEGQVGTALDVRATETLWWLLGRDESCSETILLGLQLDFRQQGVLVRLPD